jgi:hypothetical protein
LKHDVSRTSTAFSLPAAGSAQNKSRRQLD